VMEPGVMDRLREYVMANGHPQAAVEYLTESYVGEWGAEGGGGAGAGAGAGWDGCCECGLACSLRGCRTEAALKRVACDCGLRCACQFAPAYCRLCTDGQPGVPLAQDDGSCTRRRRCNARRRAGGGGRRRRGAGASSAAAG
jgi:hypothetical protein